MGASDLRRALLPGMIAVLASLGCNGGGTRPLEEQLSIRILAPGDGKTVTFADDLDPATPWIQLVPAVEVDDTKGLAAISSASLTVRPVGAAEGTAGPPPQISATRVSFPGLTLPFGDQVLEVEVTTQTGESAKASVTVHVENGRPEVLGVSFPADTYPSGAPDRRLNWYELYPAGNVVVAEVSTRGAEDGQPVQITDPAGTTVYGSGVVESNLARVTLSELDPNLEADYPLVVHVSNKDGLANNTGTEQPGDRVNTTAFSSVRVDEFSPTPELAPLAKTQLDWSDDADPTTPGFQIVLSGSSSAPDVAVFGVTLIDAFERTVMVPADGGTIAYPLTIDSSGDYTVQLTAIDEAGNDQGGCSSDSFSLNLDSPADAG